MIASFILMKGRMMYLEILGMEENTICTRTAFSFVERIRFIVGNIILISILEGIQSVEFSMKKVQNRRKQSLLWSIGITIMEK